jgi:FkbM family methyltransferase
MIKTLLKITPSFIKTWLRKLSYIRIFSDFKSLNGEAIQIRSHSTDSRVVFATFVRQFHVPPKTLVSGDAKFILDLGSNIGLTIAHFGNLYSSARIIGVEMDEQNALLCRRNIQFLKERAKVLNAAIWTEDGTVEYDDIECFQDGLSLLGSTSTKASSRKKVASICINSLLNNEVPENRIDLVKMDIEGAEVEVLRKNTRWAERVNVIMVECHPPYTKEHCRIDLEKLGFETTFHSTHFACVIGKRNDNHE